MATRLNDCAMRRSIVVEQRERLLEALDGLGELRVDLVDDAQLVERGQLPERLVLLPRPLRGRSGRRTWRASSRSRGGACTSARTRRGTCDAGCGGASGSSGAPALPVRCARAAIRASALLIVISSRTSSSSARPRASSYSASASSNFFGADLRERLLTQLLDALSCRLHLRHRHPRSPHCLNPRAVFFLARA